MRYSLLFIAAFFIGLSSGCEQAIDEAKEKAAIVDVINKETDSYLKRDFEGMKSTHVHDSLNMRLTAGADSYVFIEGWEDVSKHMTGDETEDELGSDRHISVEKSNFRIKLYPNSAFVVCDQKWTSDFGGDVTEINSIQVRFLEKIEGEWKISFVSFIGTSGYEEPEEEEVLD